MRSIRIQFTQNMDSKTINTQNIRLWDYGFVSEPLPNAIPVGGKHSIVKISGSIYHFNTNASFYPNRRYGLSFSSAIKDDLGLSILQQTKTWSVPNA
ncbi:MAG: hypothetical protein CR982_03470 [Candidatus Cloacimonadota bacterium]|nr:MAG: hypothetical protein CR982_03470 [Candidatus Cloacimonadota bacterium]